MALSHRIIFRKELQNFMLEIKEGKPEDEILEKYLTKIWNISNERKKDMFWQLLLKIYEDDYYKLKGDIARITLLDSWGGDRKKALSVVYPAIVKTQRGFDIMDKFKQYEELSARKPLIYDNSGLPIP